MRAGEVHVASAEDEVSYDTAQFNLEELDLMGSRNAVRAVLEAVIARLEDAPDAGDNLTSRVFPWGEADVSFDYRKANRNETSEVMVEVGAAPAEP